MAFVPYAQGQASGFGSGLPRAIHAQHVAEQARAAALSAFAAGQAQQPPPLAAHAAGHTTRPNIVRHVTGGLQALYSGIANAAIEQAENEQRRQQQLQQQRSQSSRSGGRSSHSPRQSYGNDVARAGVEAADIAAAAAGGAAGAVPPSAQDWTRSDGFLRISSTLPLLNQSVHRHAHCHRQRAVARSERSIKCTRTEHRCVAFFVCPAVRLGQSLSRSATGWRGHF